MRRRTLMPALLAAVLAAGVTGTVLTAPAVAQSDVVNTTTSALAASMRELVFQMSYNAALPFEVRDAAYVAVVANDEAKIREFTRVGYGKALNRAKAREALNLQVVREINRTAIPGSDVHGTSGEALRGSDNARESYVQSGYDESRERDRVNDNKRQERLARLAGEDRDYVIFLATDDPGLQVRAAAQRALHGGDDRSIGLFFSYEWKIGAELDTERFIRTATEQSQLFHDRIRALTESAQAAEKAERESSGELARKHRLEAKETWAQVDREAGQSSVDWLAEKVKADAQAAAWARVAEYARGAQSEQDWAEIIARATASGSSWRDTADSFRAQAAKWQEIAEQARKAAKDAADRDLGDR
ncbi:hypothetical protein [Lentzea californiensis]|uniref:hypothetical protein n=1 Tax=Lentzea californiensis TaxID=438851 RepID=UPI0021660AE5|nr:hypothetical protein [Lentzea californiensis]